jgi:hypothetical protein
MSHYSDIGFKLTKNEDVIELFNRINKDESIKRGSWDLNGSDDTIYVMYYFGEIRYSVELDNVNNYINRIGLGHNNERISKAIYNGKIKVGEDTGEFDTLVIKKDGIPFWFSCPNMGIFHIKEDEHEDLDLKIASFANYLEIIDPVEEETKVIDEIQEEVRQGKPIDFANESYISNFENDPCEGFVSGIIQGFKLETNPLTGETYYAIDIDCLGLYFKLLVDVNLIEYQEIKVGRVARGVFFNTALLVADNHPDYF